MDKRIKPLTISKGTHKVKFPTMIKSLEMEIDILEEAVVLTYKGKRIMRMDEEFLLSMLCYLKTWQFENEVKK